MKKFLAAVLVLHLLAALALSAAPSLHEVLHHDCDSSGHQCLLVCLQGGGMDSAPPVAELGVPALDFDGHVPSSVESSIPFRPFRLHAGRAPPA